MQIRKRRAVCAAATAIVLTVCVLLSGWHQATVIHARCAQHGELYHVGAGSHHVADHRIAATDGDAGDEHDHCAMCSRAHDGAAATRAIVRIAMPPAAPRPIAPPRAQAPGASCALADAPKTSPPIAAISLS